MRAEPEEINEDKPVEWSEWPPPRASRAVRRHCVHLVKAGYCVLCGTEIRGGSR
ncbi:hypothetical protein SEA_LITTLETOKYO_66 [Arthrobacter phage LittleTokyo]|nr:hypothetical protein SEA_LITTLETOKYO_66 [Arthrobacter phage LittleTokyo]